MTLSSASGAPHVPETRFGKWFLRTETWTVHVLERAVANLVELIPNDAASADRPNGGRSFDTILDVGCGSGKSLKKLHDRFSPKRLIAIDIDPLMLQVARREAAKEGIAAELIEASSSRLPFEDASIDLLFCHQTFHHLVEQDDAIKEFYRVLKPGGLMLFAESTREYIESWIIRLLFRHPAEVQRTADEYLAMVRAAGFVVQPGAVSYPFLWWSRPDLGILESFLKIKPPANRKETLLNLVAQKPA